MAISVNNVYQKVLAIANKEQRGYITPQEFNLYADLAQKEIFEQYFYDINQMNRMPGNSTEFSDQLYILEEKIAPFRVNDVAMTSTTEIITTSTFESGTLTGWFDSTGDNSAPVVVANANNDYIPSLQLDDTNAAVSSVFFNAFLTIGRKYRLKAKVSHANDPEANEVPMIKLEAYNISDTADDGVNQLKVEAIKGKEYVLDFLAYDDDGGGDGSTEIHQIKITLDETDASGAIVNFSEISLKEIDNTTLATNVYRLGEVLYNSPTTNFDTPIAEVTANQLTTYNLSPLARPTTANPVYVRTAANSIEIHPTTLETGSSISYNYIKSPATPKWTFNVFQGKAIYNSSATDAQDFELHESEENTLTNKILQLAGVSMSRPDVSAAGQQKEVQEVSQQKS